MTRSLLCLVLLAAVLPLRAEDASPEEAARGLRETADWLKSSDSDVLINEGDKTVKVSREQALSTLYSDLAGAQYKLAAGAADGEGDEAQAGLARVKASRAEALRDAEAATIDPKSLTGSCRNVCTWWGGCVVRYCNAIAGVRGGRKLNDETVKSLASLETELDEAARGFMARSPGAIRATPYIRAGRVYEKMAAAMRPNARPEGPQDGALPRAAADKELSPREVYAKAGPAVVVIIAADASGGGELGTGSLIDAKGRVLTNAHVVVSDKTGKPFPKVRYYLKPSRVSGDPKRDLSEPRHARVVRFDRELDLALLEPEEAVMEAPALSLADSEDVQAGEPVVAIGHPEQGGLWTLTTGVVSTVVADLGGVKGKDAFQTDASINRGNSGGPLLDRRGRVIGVNTSMARKAADGLTITSVNFAVRSNVARRWLGDLADSMPAPAPAPEPQPEPKKAPEPAKPAERPAESKPQILTEKRPFKIEDAIEQEMAEMEDLEKEMRGEIERRR